MKDILKTGLTLFVICAVAAFALALTNSVTEDKIQMQRHLANEKAKMEVLPSAATFEDVEGDELADITSKFSPVIEVYVGYDASNEVVGYVFKSKPTGFGGPMEIITGIDAQGNVSGVRMGNHQETPGLGARAKEPGFYELYNGKSAAGHLGVAKSNPTETDIQSITGATISTVAINDGVNASIDAYHYINGN